MRLQNTIIAIALFGATVADAQIRPNDGFKTNVVPRNDDGSSQLTPIGWNLNFFGRVRSSAYVNNNGNITFDAPLSEYTPFGLTGVQREIIAAFFSDVDTRPVGSNLVTYGQDTIDGRKAFGANYIDVGYFNIHADLLNRFQLLLIQREDTGNGNFDIEFNYERIVWETGDASGGTGGRGGVSAAVGWSNGSGLPGTSFELPGSLIPGSFLDNGPYSLARRRSVGTATQTGRWVFRARGGVVIPNLTIVSGCPVPNASAGRLYAYRFQAVGARPPYRWTALADPGSSLPGLTMSTAGILSGSPPTPGTYGFTVQATSNDEEGEVSVSQRCSITVDPPNISVMSSSVLPTALQGNRYDSRLLAEGGTGPFRFDLMNSAPVPGLTLSREGVLSGVPSNPGTYQFQVQASSEGRDLAVPAIKRFKVTVQPSAVSLRSACPLPNGTGGVPYSFQFQAQGGVGPYRWTALSTLPPGLTLTDEGILRGLPTVPHWWPFDVRVQDSRGASAQAGCGVVILFPEVRVSNSCPLPTATAGIAYSQRLQATGGNAPFGWSVDGTLPIGLRLATDGTLSGTPLSAGTSQFRLRVTDRSGQASGSACSLVVTRGQYGISGCPLPVAYAGEPYNYRYTATGGSEPYFWSEAASLPSGLRLSPDGFVSGNVSTAGTYPVAVRATDGSGRSTTSSCSLNVLPQALRLNNPCDAGTSRLGESYSYQLNAAGGAEPYIFTARGLPPGLAASESGRISGAPTQAGNFPVEFTVRDRLGRTATATCSIVVNLPDQPDVRITGLPAVLSPASTGPTVTLELSKVYPVAIEGSAVLEVAAETNSPSAGVNRDDPSVRFSSGQRTATFTIAAGSRQTALVISSTGTVASVVTVRITRLRASGFDFVRLPVPAVTKINRSVPVVTSVCYTPNTSGFDVDISGYSTTRDLISAVLSFGSNTYNVDLVNSSSEYFGSDDSVRTGGTFRVRAPYRLTAGTAQTLGQGNAVVSNAVGSAASRSIARCQ